MLLNNQLKRLCHRLATITVLFLLGSVSVASAAISSPAKTSGFIALSDIHFNPFASCPASGTCPLAIALIHSRWQQWDSLFQQYGVTTPNSYKSDSNDALLLSTLNDLQTRQLHPKFVIIPGDFLAHDMVEHYKKYSGDENLRNYSAFINKVFFYLSNKIKQTFPNTPVYPVIGNNDSYHGDYYSAPNGPFYRFLSQNSVWGQFFINPNNKIAFKRHFTVGGYYKITPPGDNQQRIIVLNSVLFSNKATGPNNRQAAQAELKWLESQLQLAQRQRQKVWLVFHIPYGVDVYSTINNQQKSVMFWQYRNNQRFLALLKQYHNVIQAIITGHVHMDGFQYTTLANHNLTVINSFVPGISPLFGNNPGYKYYRYFSKDFTLSDFTVYYLNLAATTRQWQQEYDFNQVYQPNCQHCLLVTGMKMLSAQGRLSHYYRYYYTLGTGQQPISDDKYWPDYWCGIQYQTKSAFEQCRRSSSDNR